MICSQCKKLVTGKHYKKTQICHSCYSKNYFKNPKNRARMMNYMVKNQKRIIKELRIKIISHYSNGTNKCACCGESIYEFLSIDHLNNDGNKHRKKIGTGVQFYYWIINNNYPKEFQVMCMNCNWGRARTPNHVCPHKYSNIYK